MEGGGARGCSLAVDADRAHDLVLVQLQPHHARQKLLHEGRLLKRLVAERVVHDALQSRHTLQQRLHALPAARGRLEDGVEQLSHWARRALLVADSIQRDVKRLVLDAAAEYVRAGELEERLHACERAALVHSLHKRPRCQVLGVVLAVLHPGLHQKATMSGVSSGVSSAAPRIAPKGHDVRCQEWC